MTHFTRDRPAGVLAASVIARAGHSQYPEPYASRLSGRIKRRLSDLFGVRNFGVNLTTLEPGGRSALHHSHSKQDEFVFILEGEAVLVTSAGETILKPGECFGFPAGGNGHHLENRGSVHTTYLEIGDRTQGDIVSYPFDDLIAIKKETNWIFYHKDGTPY